MSAAYATVDAGGIDDEAWLLLSRTAGTPVGGAVGGTQLRPPLPPSTLTTLLADGGGYLPAGGCYGDDGGVPPTSVPSSAMPLEHFKARATEVAHQQYDRGPGRKRRMAAAARGCPADPTSEESLKKERKLKSAYVSRYRGTIYVDLLKAAIVAAEADNTASRGSVAVAADTNARLAAQCAELERELVLLNERWRVACGADPALGGLDARRVVGRKRPKMAEVPPPLPLVAVPQVSLTRAPPAEADTSPRSGRFSLASAVSPASSPPSRPIATAPPAAHGAAPPRGGSTTDAAPDSASNFPMMCNLAAKAISVEGCGNGGGKFGGKAVSSWPDVSFNEWMPALDDDVCEAAPAA
ncbi:hypothetical protein I4F81_008381 [Pyropia yezoensis]|uniref:Uncharacterized protein n=1 Tax=Pyropia yezoensis TaxID=2788 RepID=A0ACC3C7K4_PYRYE|nr:hypothetical protein I4F81_008381 [Neopyropia yezoensis]